MAASRGAMRRPAPALLAAAAAARAAERPHIVMLLADDFGWANAGWHRPAGGDAEVRTPVLDALVRSGVELDRAYQYRSCSPSRSSLQSGRLPVHVNIVNTEGTVYNPRDPMSGFAGIPRNMTGVAQHLKAAGYATHHVGKWDAGMATLDHTPLGRGYDSSFGYFNHANDYWTERFGGGSTPGPFVDLWDTDAPAYGMNGTHGSPTWETDYEEYKFKTRVLGIVAAHDPAAPLFMCYCFHLVHAPLQVPNATFAEFAFMTDDYTGKGISGVPHRRTYHAMVKYLDDTVGEVVGLLRQRGMWDHTLVVFQADNGGPSFAGGDPAANNYPLKGSKLSDWEGGIRGSAFVAGGFLERSAPARVGVKLEGYTHICDWYATFAGLAGVDPADRRAAAAGLPPIDSLDLWPYLTGAAAASPRTEIFANPGVLISGDWKLIGANGANATRGAGTDVGIACWTGPRYPNGSTDPAVHHIADDACHCTLPVTGCNRTEPCAANGGCLYQIKEDPGEHTDLAAAQPRKLQEMKQRLAELQPTIFSPNRFGGDVSLPVRYARDVYHGYWGPFIFP